MPSYFIYCSYSSTSTLYSSYSRSTLGRARSIAGNSLISNHANPDQTVATSVRPVCCDPPLPPCSNPPRNSTSVSPSPNLPSTPLNSPITPPAYSFLALLLHLLDSLSLPPLPPSLPLSLLPNYFNGFTSHWNSSPLGSS